MLCALGIKKGVVHLVGIFVAFALCGCVLGSCHADSYSSRLNTSDDDELIAWLHQCVTVKCFVCTISAAAMVGRGRGRVVVGMGRGKGCVKVGRGRGRGRVVVGRGRGRGVLW